MSGPRVGIVGPLLGHHPGWVVSQGERLAQRLVDDGVTVRTTSGRIGRAARAVDTVRTIRSWKGDVDVVVVMVFSGPAFAMTDLATRSAGALQVPVVLWLHGGNLPDFARRHRRWADAVGRRAAAVVAPSPYLVGAVGTATTRGPGRAPVVIPNVLAEACRPFAPRRPLRPRLLWMRTFHPLYRPEWAIDVLARLLDHCPDATLTMAGQDRGGLSTVRTKVHDAGLDQHVRFAGFLDAPAKDHAFADHDLFVNTSAADNAPVSLLEAAAHGLPIVSTAVGGIPDLFPDGGAALLADDPAGLAEAAVRLLDDADLAAALAGAAHDRARESTWERVGPRWRRLLEEVVAHG